MNKAVAVVEEVLRVEDLGQTLVSNFLARLGLNLEWLPANSTINGSYWGEPEAGIIGESVYVRDDTPVHSMLHEVCHIICMSADRRSCLDRDAGSDVLGHEPTPLRVLQDGTQALQRFRRHRPRARLQQLLLESLYLRRRQTRELSPAY